MHSEIGNHATKHFCCDCINNRFVKITFIFVKIKNECLNQMLIIVKTY